jgi:putative ABC transport system substrate-binding protein
MRRREFSLLAGTTLLLPHVVRAQQKERIRRIGYLTPATGSPEDELGVRQTRALVEGLRELGWVDGRNITIEHHFSGAGRDRIDATAKELVELKPDVIVTVGGARAAAVLAETQTTPVVFTMVSDPIAGGLVPNLAHPGGNATGFAYREMTLPGKQLQLLKEIVPFLTRVLVITNPQAPAQRSMNEAVVTAAPSLGVTVATVTTDNLGDLERQIAERAREPNGGLVVLNNSIVTSNQTAFHMLALRYRLPAVYSLATFAQSGGLVSYGSDQIAVLHAVADYVDKILRGAKPGDLPVQLPTKFYLAVNLKTAKALGLTVPPSILARADEVIE